MTDSAQEDLSHNSQGGAINGDFRIRVSDDQLAVYLSDLSLPRNGGEALTLDRVMARLKSQKITADIDKAKINAFLSAANTGAAGEALCIAKGVTPVEGVDGELVWNIPERYLRLHCAVVLPGDLIARYKVATKGQPGKTVYGKDISVSNGANRQLHIGAGIKTQKIEGGDEYLATYLGIVTTEQDHAEFIQLDRLLKIAEDGMAASMDIYAQSASGQAITCEAVMAELSSSGVTHGIDPDIIQMSLKKVQYLSSDKPIACVEKVVVARGITAQPGKDACLILSREDNVIGAELSHGYIDFNERGYPWNVSNGDRVGYLRKAKPGVDGMTVTGSTIKVAKPKDIKYKFEGLHGDESGRIFADLDGALIINGHSLAVVDLLVINGDVGAKTGNIHSKIAVHVKGHVKPGFTLESENDVIVDHNVEDATVRSGSSIMIKGGIRGMKSRVYSPADVRAGFVENASIYVNGGLVVNGSIMNSIVASNGAVFVGDQKVKHSMVVGGELIVHEYLEVAELGSDAYFKTLVRLGMAQEERRQIILIDKEMDEIQKKLQDIQQIEYRHRLTPKEDTKDVLYKLAITRKALSDQNLRLEQKKNAIVAHLKQTGDARAVVKKCVYPGVTVFINDSYYKVHNKLGAGSFIFDKKSDRVVYVAD